MSSTAWDKYQNRAAVRPTDIHRSKMEDLRQTAQTNTDILAHVLEMLVDHANMLDAMKFRIKELQGFMDWATTTHPNIFAEYKAVGDLAQASGGNTKLDKLLKDWTES